MGKYNVLIADDEERIRILVGDFLRADGYNVLEAADGKTAMKIFEEDEIDLAILDIMMPYMDGLEVCRLIRKTSDIPIIMLTAKNQDIDQMIGFGNGTNDYVTKPFNPNILMLRVQSLLQLTNTDKDESVHTVGVIKLNTESYEAYIDGEELHLLPREFQLLLYLMKNKGRVITREVLLDNVWGMDYPGTDRTVDSHINRLRQKLSEHRGMLKTLRGSGYKLDEE